MPKTINIYDAKAQLSRLVEQAASGEEIIIAKNGHPRARLVPLGRPAGRRTPGALRGRVEIAADFDAPLPKELMRGFSGGE